MSFFASMSILMFIKDEPNNFKMYYVQAFTESESANISDKNYIVITLKKIILMVRYLYKI